MLLNASFMDLLLDFTFLLVSISGFLIEKIIFFVLKPIACRKLIIGILFVLSIFA